MAAGFLLDTNVVPELTRSRVNPNVRAWVGGQDLGMLQIRVVRLGEIEKGLALMRDEARRTTLELWLERQFLELFRGQILPVTQAIAKRWGAMGAKGQMAGRPLAAPDGLIAATAFEHDLVVATRNVKDFEGLGVPVFHPWVGESGAEGLII